MASTYTNLHIHVIFATKGRAPTIAPEWRSDLHAYLGGTVRGLGAVPLAIGGVADHVHLLVGIKATQPVADLVREIKKASSAWASERWRDFAWQTGYAAFSVGPSKIARIRAYVETQEKHHRMLSSAEELRMLLDEHGVEYDERYFQ